MTDTAPANASASTVLDEVVELVQADGSHHHVIGLFRSVEGAQARAAEKHQGFVDLIATLTECEREETEDVFPELQWGREQLYVDSRQRIPLAGTHLVAWSGPVTKFYLRHTPVGP